MEDKHTHRGLTNLRISAAALLLAAITSGCMQTQLNSAAVVEAPVRPVNQPADNYEWVKRLKLTDPIEGITQMNRSGAQVAYQVPVPVTAGSRFALIVDQQMGLAWLQSSDGQLGPWPLDQPDVTHLLKSVAIPPTNPTAAQ